MIELYGLSLSTFCAKVEIVLQVKQLDYQLIAPAGGSYRSDAYQALIPAATIPAIRHDDFYLHDSDAICEYLEDICPTPAMRPADSKERARHRAIAHFHDSRLDAAVRALFPSFSVTGNVDQQQIEHSLDTFHLRLSQLARLVDATIFPGPYLGGESLSLADCGFLPTIRMGERLFDAFDAPVTLPGRISQWCDALNDHPVVNRVLAVNQQALEVWINSKQ